MNKILVGTTALAMLATFDASAQRAGRGLEESTVTSRTEDVRARSAARVERRRGTRGRTVRGGSVALDTAFASAVLSKTQETLSRSNVELSLRDVQVRVAEATRESMTAKDELGRAATKRVFDYVVNPSTRAQVPAARKAAVLGLVEKYASLLVVGAGRLQFENGTDPIPTADQIIAVTESWKSTRAIDRLSQLVETAALEMLRNPSIRGFEAWGRAIDLLNREFPGFKRSFRNNCKRGALVS